MANRAMTAKIEKAKVQRIEAGKIEGSKPFYQGNGTLAAANAKREMLATMVAGYAGEVSYCKPGAGSTEHKRAGYDGTRASRRARAELTGNAVRAGSCWLYRIGR